MKVVARSVYIICDSSKASMMTSLLILRFVMFGDDVLYKVYCSSSLDNFQEQDVDQEHIKI